MTSKQLEPKRNKNQEFIFSDFTEFKPNLSPEEIFRLGSFGGTYWRPIYSSVTKKHYKNEHLKFPWFKDIPNEYLIKQWEEYDKSINKYHEKVGSTLEDWEEKHWIIDQDPYGWIQWYCNFFLGRRTDDDERQISRWKGLTGIKGRFRKSLINQIIRKNGKYDDYKISPKIRQTLQHWGYALTEKDFNKENSKLIVNEIDDDVDNKDDDDKKVKQSSNISPKSNKRVKR